MYKKKIIYVLAIIVFAFCLSCFNYNYKTPIHEVSYDKLIDIEYVGPKRTELIQDYLQDNPTCKVNDLIDINGIGPEILKNIKEKFR